MFSVAQQEEQCKRLFSPIHPATPGLYANIPKDEHSCDSLTDKFICTCRRTPGHQF